MTTLAATRRPPLAPLAPRRAPPDAPEPNGFGFGLFILVNAILFVRPADVVPAFINIEFYQYAILACLLVSFPAVLDHLQPAKMEKRPIDLCVIGLFFATVLSHAASARLDRMVDEGFASFKVVVYYLLFVALVTTPARLRTFSAWIALFACAVAALSALDYHKVIRLPRALSEFGVYAIEDEERMYGPGIFQDPNDVGLLIVAAAMLLLGRLSDSKAGSLRVLWLLPLSMFGYAFYLTRSRGAMLALLAGLGTLALLRWGWRVALLLALLVAPLGLAVLSGRNLDLKSHQDTGQTRIQLWNAAMVHFRANPVFGVGTREFHRQPEVKHVAHSSYMQAFVETGFVGGMLFVGAILFSAAGLLSMRNPVTRQGRVIPRRILDPVMDQQFPFVAAAVVAFAAGMLTLTLNYLVVTYAFFGMASMVLATARTDPERAPPRFDLGTWGKLAGVSLLFLVGMFGFIRLFLA
ncbi:MAG: O-antigen ligase family protein [Gemmataceae bacterium]|nr:O-antigen ligase family protein [Gemmataceae bacterium]